MQPNDNQERFRNYHDFGMQFVCTNQMVIEVKTKRSLGTICRIRVFGAHGISKKMEVRSVSQIIKIDPLGANEPDD